MTLTNAVLFDLEEATLLDSWIWGKLEVIMLVITMFVALKEGYKYRSAVPLTTSESSITTWNATKQQQENNEY